MFEKVSDLKLLFPQFLFSCGFLVVAFIALRLTPNPAGFGTHVQLGLGPCPIAATLHHPCPGCGLTTCFTNIMHGHFGEAFHDHWLGPVFFAYLAGVSALSLFGTFTRSRLTTDSNWFQRVTVVVLSGVMAYGLLRMIFVHLN